LSRRTKDEKKKDEKMSDEKEMSTVIDRVLDFIQRKGRTTITEVAVSLAVQPSQVEHLASILEESGMIKVKYALIDSGKTELISKQQTEAGNEAVDKLRSDVERIKSLGQMINKDIEKFESDYKSIERDVSQWIVEAEDTLNALKERNGGNSESAKQAEEIERIAKEFQSRIIVSDQRVVEEAKTMQERFKSFQAKATQIKAGKPAPASRATPPKSAGGASTGFGIGKLFGKK
jgi:Mn-dependent DtxR family transcriptional regulator